MKRNIETLTGKARKANGLERACFKCNHYPCPEPMFKVCSEAFVRGYKKGYERRRKEQKHQIATILHDASEDVGNEEIFIFFRDVRGDEDAAFIERTRFIEPEDVHIGEIKFKPKRKDDPQQLPIAWIKEDDLLELLGYKDRFNELEAISLYEGSFTYPILEYEANLEKYKEVRTKFSKHKKK